MNQKKCPKCGENNPAEAVMCWACYTPLSGGGAVAAGAGGGTVAATGAAAAHHHQEEGEKKPIAPWQIGVLVVALLIGVGVGVSQFMGKSSSDPIEVPGGPPPNYGPPPGFRNPSPPSAPPPPSNFSGPTGGGGSVTPTRAPYTMTTAPDPNQNWGVMALVPTDPNIGVQRAASLAMFARNQFKNVRGWNGMQIFVFRDAQSAQEFNRFQLKRRNAELGEEEFRQLATLWPNCIAGYVATDRAARVVYPSQSPGGWWSRLR